MTELTKTLELKLVDPNHHKRQKFRKTRDAYQQSLQAAFTRERDIFSLCFHLVIVITNYERGDNPGSTIIAV